MKSISNYLNESSHNTLNSQMFESSSNDKTYFYIENRKGGDMEIYLENPNIHGEDMTLSYSTTGDKNDWESITIPYNEKNNIVIRNAKRCYFKCISNHAFTIFDVDTEYNVGGCLSSLFTGDPNIEPREGEGSFKFGFVHLFTPSEDNSLVDASKLIFPSTGEASGMCYARMFQGCKKLKVAPRKLPATKLKPFCYDLMFADCTSLRTVPELPATELSRGCYRWMFKNCTSLKTAPELPATELVKSCYLGMFNKCTSLRTAPELPATKLGEGCYREMFDGCTSLENVPELPATDLEPDCYKDMLKGCTKIDPKKLPENYT